MGWGKLCDTLHSHMKTRRAGLEAMGLWTVSMSWSSQQLAEGFVPEWFVESWPRGKSLATKLVKAGLWKTSEREGDKGWQFHDWTDYNPTAEAEKARKKAAADRQKRARQKAAVTRDVARDGTRDERRESRLPRPDPSRPVPETYSGGDLTVGNAHEEPPLYSGRCWEHRNVAEPPRCGGCADARKSGRPLLVAVPDQPLLRCLVHAQSHSGVCTGCAADEKAVNA